MKKIIFSIRDRAKNFFLYLKSKRKIIAGILGVSVLTASLGTGIYLVQKVQSAKTEAGSIVLSLSTNNAAPKVGDTFTVAVAIDTKGLLASAADIRVRYDTSKLEAKSIQPMGGFLPIVLVPGKIDLTDTSSGRASITLGALVNQTEAYPKNGIGVLTQITFQAKAAGPTDITFGTATAVSAIGQTTNAAGSLNPVQITISSGNATSPGSTPSAGMPIPVASQGTIVTPTPGATSAPTSTTHPGPL